MSELRPTAHLVQVPIHVNWVNQAEIFLSIIQRKCSTPNDIHDLVQIKRRLFSFEHR